MGLTRQLKLLGLVALAALGSGSLGSSVAQAAEGWVVVSGGPAGWTATQTGGGQTLTLPGGRTLACSTATLSGSVANGSKKLAAMGLNEGCSAKVGGSTLPATVSWTGCSLDFYDFTTTAANTYAAKTDLVCPSGQYTQIRLYATAFAHTVDAALCEYRIESQAGLSGTHLTDNANNTLGITMTEVEVSIYKPLGYSIANCGAALTSGKINGSFLVTPSAGTTIDMTD